MTTTAIKFTEAKSRHITPALSVFDFQQGDGLLIKSGDSVVRKLVTELNPEAGTVTATDPDGGGAVTVKLDPDNPAKDGSEFKYWIDESGDTMSQRSVSEMDELDDLDDMSDLDDLDMGMGDAEFEEEDDDYGDDDMMGMGDMDDMDDFGEDLKAFLGKGFNEEDTGTSTVTDQVPDNTVGGGVDDNTHSDEDGEDPESTPAPHDTTGLESPGEVQTMAGGSSSNVGGSAPSDEVTTNNSVGGPPQSPAELAGAPSEHEPGNPETHESIRVDVRTALGLVKRGANPNDLAPRLLRGEA